MRLIDDLVAEHQLIDQVAGAFRTCVARRIAGTAPPHDALRFGRFFQLYVGCFHHDREESVLFPALTGELGLPADRGPIAALLGQHHDLAACLSELEPLLASDRIDVADAESIVALARRYTRGLWHHLDAETSVLFPESEARLQRAGVFELESRSPLPAEAQAREDGRRLLHEFPPEPDPTIIRGDGCAVCPSYGSTCDGLERSWWNESEWEEFPDHLG